MHPRPGLTRRARSTRLCLLAVTVALAASGCSAARTEVNAPGSSTSSAAPTTATPTHPMTSAIASSTARRVTSAPAPSHSATASASASASAARTPSAVGSVAPAPTPAAVLAGRTIVLNPGHNGGNAAAAARIAQQVPAGFGEYKECDTTGTETNTGYSEHAFNWDVTLRVRAVLQAHGIRVILTRSDDSGVGPCVDERARIGNQRGVAAVISIHADGAPTSGHGFHVCDDSRQPAGAAVAALSHSLTVAEHDALLAGSGLTTSTYLGSNGYYPRSDLAGLNLATVPTTFLEIGNMRNAGDAAVQSSAPGRQRIADAVASGILRWLAGR